VSSALVACHPADVIARGHAVFHTFAEYIALEEATTGKHEYLGGQIYAMAGGSPEHSSLAVSVATQLANQVRGGQCRVHSSDLRVRVVETGLATYPAVTVVCGPWERDRENTQTVVNPAVLVEVLSPSTEAYDRGEKLEHYKRIPSLRAVVLVAHDRRELDVWSRPAEGAWDRSLATAGQSVVLGGIGCTLNVDAVYDDASEPT
jgi:Uma2 family endonuclease